MSFCVSHRSALDKNLRHLYSGLPSPVILRTSSTSGVLDGSLDIMDRVWEKHKRPPERFETKFQEYLPQYSARLPRAPAFRSVSPEEAREISHRLSRPTYMSAIRRQSAVRRGAAERAESRRSRATSGRVDSEYSEDVRDWRTLEAPRQDGDSKRKISYQDWSEEESGAYYYDDEGSSVVESNAEFRENYKTENNCERSSHVIDFSASPSSKKYYEKDETHRNDKLKRNNFDTVLPEATEDKKISEQFGNRKVVSGHTATGRRIRSESSSSEDESRNRQYDYRDRSTPEASNDSNHDKEHDSKKHRRSISSSSTSVTDSAQGVDSAPVPQAKSGVPPRKKISLLEQIMQARTPQRTRRTQRSKTYTDSGQYSNSFSRNAGKHNSSSHTEGYPKRLYKREPLNTRLKQSPYCEPMPQLYIVYTPVTHKREDIYVRDRANNGKSRTSYPDEWSLPRRRSQTAPGRAKTASSTGRNRRTIELQRSQERSGQRFDTKQLQTKQEYKNGSRGAAEPPSSSAKHGKNREPVRSKSVPPPEAVDVPKTGPSKSDTSRWRQSSFANSTKNDDDFNKSCAKGRQKHQDNNCSTSRSSFYFKKVPEQQKEKSTTKQKKGPEERVGSSELSSDDTNGKREDFDQVSRRRQSPRSTFTTPIRTEVHSEKFSTSKGSPDRTFHNLKTSDDIGDSEDVIHRVYYRGSDGALYYITPDDNSRRFASAEEMAKANRRLQKPTKANIIRNRMRWAPNNDKDLADPVRVIREVTGGHEGGYWQRRHGDDARGRVDYKSDDDNKERNRSSSGSSNEDNDENHLKIEQEKQEALAMKTKQKNKELKNKKDNWMKKGVIQSRKSLITTQPNSKHGSPTRNPASKKCVSNKNKLFARQRKKDENKINNQGDSHASFPQPRRKTQSPTQSPRSRSPSNDSLSSKSTVKSRSRSRSRESSPSRSRSRSRSSSSTLHSKSRSVSPPAKEPNKDAKLVHMSSPKGSTSSNEANQNIALGKIDSSTAENTISKNGYNGCEMSDDGNYRTKERSEKQNIDNNEREHVNTRQQEHVKPSETSRNTTNTPQDGEQENDIPPKQTDSEVDDTRIRGIVRELEQEEANRKATESPNSGRNSALDYSTGKGSREGRGDEYKDNFERGEDYHKSCTFSEDLEIAAEPSMYTHTRQTRGESEESARNDDQLTDNSQAYDTSENTTATVTYSIKDAGGREEIDTIKNNIERKENNEMSNPAFQKNPHSNKRLSQDHVTTTSRNDSAHHLDSEETSNESRKCYSSEHHSAFSNNDHKPTLTADEENEVQTKTR
ncbi:hypothetical protein PoB_003612100 [Plakobranchus ocellatus]|uniref:Serine/arginine repetitive matrix protein 2-like n=1 Tax=Plakobranchus ocellatus TaxID=259542 RepID=A0AAV4ASR9_9GAST|nr:hypothetical protein PoB_003612100 [Plakobranchus ocellatus]